LRSDPEILAVEALGLGYERWAPPIQVLVAEPDAVSLRLICSLVEGQGEMTAECVDDSRLVSSFQETSQDVVIFDAHTPAIRRGAKWDALGVESPPATIVAAYDLAALAVFASIAIDLLVKPFGVERCETALD
jgi:CheY-like chemotaxis protein